MRSEIWAGWKRIFFPSPSFFQLGEFLARSVPWASSWCSCMLTYDGMIWRLHKNRLKAQTGETLSIMLTRCSLNDLWGSSFPTVNKSSVRQCLQQSWGFALGKVCSSSNICLQMPASPSHWIWAGGPDVIRKTNRRRDSENVVETHRCKFLLAKCILEYWRSRTGLCGEAQLCKLGVWAACRGTNIIQRFTQRCKTAVSEPNCCKFVFF